VGTLATLNESIGGVLFKIRRDPRVTPVGRFLRSYSIDELPQFINVLRKDMSVVGPRPPLRREVDAYDDQVRRRLLVLPGITGLWQVSGRADLSWEDSVRLDLSYVENWSITSDLLIAAKTVRTVFAGTGAY
jgi:lipopolysaccharide/colanic/teichoic acid biosynthesis glycosyltransferase